MISRSLRRYLNRPNSFLHQLACGLNPHEAKRSLVLHLERLEDRHLMNGDPAPIAAASQIAEVDGNVASSLMVVDGISADDYNPLSYRSTAQFNTQPEDPQFNRINELPIWLVAEADRRYGQQFGQRANEHRVGYWNFPVLSISGRDIDTAAFSLVATDSLNDYSGTNVQVAGVDEADLVETDGEFLYVISGTELLIIDLRDVDNLCLASRVELDSRPTGMYLDGDRLTLISSAGGGWYGSDIRNGFGTALILSDFCCTPYTRTPATTEVKVLDIADATAPKLVQNTEFDGRLVSSRMVEGELRLVFQHEAQNWKNLLPQLQTYKVGTSETNQASELRYETRNEYLERVYQQLEIFSLPGYRTMSVDGQVLNRHHVLDMEDVAELITLVNGSATTIATFDTRANTAGPVATKTVFSLGAAEIYATQNSLYVFGRALPDSSGHESFFWGNNQTHIWKFDFDPSDHTIQLSAEGEIDGRLLNQFSADEHKGFLRVVTTGRTWQSGQDLFVLEQVGNQLNVVGKVSDLAPGENLHSVRFVGDEAFVVTFRRIDPLFAIDLSDPTNPFVAGELKIPGYSDYLQPLGEDHLIGIGRGADENSGFAQELQVSIFDVTDLDDPQLAHRYSFEGGRSTETEALFEHHAVSYFPDAEILAIPIYSAYPWRDFLIGVEDSASLSAQESTLQVFQIDAIAGFDPLATIKHDSRIMRSLRIGEQLIVVSTDQVTIHDLEDPGQRRSELDLRIGSGAGSVELTTYVAPESLTGLNLPKESNDSPAPVNERNLLTRQMFAPRARRDYQPAPRYSVPESTSLLDAQDTATEQLVFDLQDELTESLASELIKQFNE